MNMNVLGKYIILFLFAVLVVLSGLLIAYSAENKALQKANTVLKEQVVLRDAAINEIDKNIASLQQQAAESEKICDERLKAREDLLTFLSIEPAFDVSKNGIFFPQLSSFVEIKNGSEKSSAAGDAAELNKNNSSPLDSSLFVSTNIQNDKAQNEKVSVYEVISKNKSDYAVNSINSYISMFTTQSSDGEK